MKRAHLLIVLAVVGCSRRPPVEKDRLVVVTITQPMSMADLGMLGVLNAPETEKLAPAPKEPPFLLAPGIKDAANEVFAPKEDPRAARSDRFGNHGVVHLAPHGKAVLHARILAKGWTPKKKYRTHDTYSSPEPLPAGHYTMSREVPVDGMTVPSFTVDIVP